MASNGLKICLCSRKLKILSDCNITRPDKQRLQSNNIFLQYYNWFTVFIVSNCNLSEMDIGFVLPKMKKKTTYLILERNITMKHLSVYIQ